MGSATKSTLKPLPMLGLSRVRRRNQKVEKPQQIRPSRRTSPQCKVPLPSSFVDATVSLLAQRERAFLASSEDEEENEEEKKRRIERVKKKQSEKEQIRRRLAEAKLKLSHRFNVSETIAEEDNDAILNESTQRSKAGTLLQQNSRSFPSTSLQIENPTLPQHNDDQYKRSPSSQTGKSPQPIDKSLLHFIVDGCFRGVKDPSRVSVKELLHQVATKLHRKSLTKSQRAAARSRITELLLSWQKEQERPERLLQVIRSVFEGFAATTDGLHNCSLEQFLVETQKHFPTPFSIEAQEFVKIQLRDLVSKFQKRNTEKDNAQRSELPRPSPKRIHRSTETNPCKPVVAPKKGSKTKVAPPLDTSKEEPAEQQKERNNTTTAEIPDTPQANVTPKLPQIANKTADLSVRTIPATGQTDNDSLSLGADCVAIIDRSATRDEQPIVTQKTGKVRDPPRRLIRSRKTAVGQCREERMPILKPSLPSLRAVGQPTTREANTDVSPALTTKARTDGLKRSKPQNCSKSDSSAKKPKKVPTKKKICSLCLKCPCNDASRNSIGTTTVGLAQTDVAIEKALIRRLAKLETVADQYEEQTEAARRKLKKHRRDMWKKREDLLKRAGKQIANKRSATYFLPDVEELDDQFSKRKRAKRGTECAAKAKARLVNINRSESKQRTLTQMANESEEIGEDPIIQNEDTCQTTEELVLSDIEESSCDEDEAAFANGEVAVRRVLATNHGNGSLWDGVRSGNFQSAFDNLFDEQVASDESDGVEQLLELMMSSPKKQAPSTSTCHESPSNLSFRGKKLTEEVTEKTLADTANLHAIEELCPQWKENVVFAMAQRESTDVTDAIRNVQQEKHRLIDLREKFLQAIKKRVTTLDFYEKTLKVSASRTGCSGSGTSVSEAEL